MQYDKAQVSGEHASDHLLRRRSTNFVLFTTTTFAVLLGFVGFLGLQNAELVRQRSSLRTAGMARATELAERLRISRLEVWRVGRRLRDGADQTDPEEFAERLHGARQAIAEVDPPLDDPELIEEWNQAESRTLAFLADAEMLARGGPLRDGFVREDRLIEAQADEAREELRQFLDVVDNVTARRTDEITARALRLQRISLALVIACAGLALVGSVVSVRFVGRLFDRLRQSQEAITKVSGLLLEKQEEAARRLSQELHDELGQNLTALKASVRRLSPAMNLEDFDSQKSQALAILDESISSTRNLSQLMHPRVLDDLGLAAALEWLADSYSERTGIVIDTEVSISHRLDTGLRHQLFRIAQEALTNIARHSGATRAEVALWETRTGAEKTVNLRVTDNGSGMPTHADPSNGLGLAGMRARASMVGGVLTFAPDGAKGFSIEVTAPAVVEHEST